MSSPLALSKAGYLHCLVRTGATLENAPTCLKIVERDIQTNLTKQSEYGRFDHM